LTYYYNMDYYATSFNYMRNTMKAYFNITTKKDRIRKAFKVAPADSTFTVKSFADMLAKEPGNAWITVKDVDNVLREMLRYGLVSRDGKYRRGPNGRKHQVWTIASNRVRRVHFAKYPVGIKNPPKAAPKAAPLSAPSLTTVSETPTDKVVQSETTGKKYLVVKKRRPPLVIGIDNEITELKRKIKLLEDMRKEFYQ